MEYRIFLTESSKEDLDHLKVHDQRIVLAGIFAFLKQDAEVESRRRKMLRPNPIAPWELRIDRFRVFYTVEEKRTVKVIAVGYKEHNRLFIRGLEAPL